MVDDPMFLELEEKVKTTRLTLERVQADHDEACQAMIDYVRQYSEAKCQQCKKKVNPAEEQVWEPYADGRLWCDACVSAGKQPLQGYGWRPPPRFCDCLEGSRPFHAPHEREGVQQ